MARPKMTMDRLFAKSSPEPTTGCWIYMGRMNRGGYGQIFFDKKSEGAHRVSVILSGREIPGGMQIDHKCRNKICVNPAHLEVVTRLENMRRRFAPQTSCKRGHDFDAENTYYAATGHRKCKTCRKASWLAFYRENKGAS